MLDIKLVREQPDLVKRAIDNKRLGHVDVDRVLELDQARRDLLQKTEGLRARRNALSSSIPKASAEDRPKFIAEVKAIKADLVKDEAKLEVTASELGELMLLLPQIPGDDVPVGKDEDDNVELRKIGAPRVFDFKPRDHEELGSLLDIIDKKRAVRFAGGRSYLLKGAGAMLELAVMRLALDVVVERGFQPVLGPLMVNSMALEGTGFFPHGKEDVYHLEKDDKWLIGTSEVHLVSIHAGEVLDESELPLRYAGHSACFRREAGSYGRDTKGIYRVHQFSKVEQVIIAPASTEGSLELHQELLANSLEILRRLDLPHRVVAACTGEIGQGKVRMTEIETWMPSRGKYSETHSCSTLHDFQARRMNIRYKDSDGKVRFCHTLNNTAIASPRILIPILETYQNEDGSVNVPEALKPYMYGITRIEPPTKKV